MESPQILCEYRNKICISGSFTYIFAHTPELRTISEVKKEVKIVDMERNIRNLVSENRFLYMDRCLAHNSVTLDALS